MEKWKKIVARLLVVFAAVFLVACSSGNEGAATDTDTSAPAEETSATEEDSSEESSDQEGTPASGISFTDQMGNEVQLDQPAETVVVEYPSDAEILFAMGAGDKIVGRGQFVDYPAEEVESIPVVAENAEEIIALDPDLVVLGNFAQPEFVQQLQDAGLTIMQQDAQNMDQIYESIELLGQAVGYEDEAAQVIEDMQTAFDELEAAADEVDLENNRVYYEISPLEYGLWSGGTGTFMSQIGELLNLENVFPEAEGNDQWFEVSEEEVLAANPDIIITTSTEENPEEEIMNRPGWDAVSAVQNGQVYAVDDQAFTRPGPRLVDAARELFDYIYGEILNQDEAA